MAYGTLNADLMTTSDGVNSSGLYGFKNRIINGAMMIDQRNAGASVSNPNAYILDRWYVETSLSTTACQQVVDAPTGFYNSLKFTTSTGGSVVAGSYIDISQPIEGFNVADLGYGGGSASPVTISFWVKSSVTGTYSTCLRMPNAGTPVGSTQSFTINSANTWEQKSITVTGNTTAALVANNSAQLRLYIFLAAGSTYQTSSSNTWVSTNGGYNALNTQTNGMFTTTGATFYITGVQLEKGSTATSFDYRPYGTELMLCQRYYEKIQTTASVGGYYNNGYAYSATQSESILRFAVWKRATPTCSSSGTFGFPTSVSSLSFDQPSLQSVLVYKTGMSLTSGTAFRLLDNNSGASYMEISSEL